MGNAVLIYYILYNKFSNISSDTEVLDTYSLDDSINKLVINNNVYNTYEADYKNLYELIVKKIDDLEKKIKEKNTNNDTNNDYEKIKLELETTKKNLEQKENEVINKENSNISIINNHIDEYNELL